MKIYKKTSIIFFLLGALLATPCEGMDFIKKVVGLKSTKASEPLSKNNGDFPCALCRALRLDDVSFIETALRTGYRAQDISDDYGRYTRHVDFPAPLNVLRFLIERGARVYGPDIPNKLFSDKLLLAIVSRNKENALRIFNNLNDHSKESESGIELINQAFMLGAAQEQSELLLEILNKLGFQLREETIQLALVKAAFSGDQKVINLLLDKLDPSDSRYTDTLNYALVASAAQGNNTLVTKLIEWSYEINVVLDLEKAWQASSASINNDVGPGAGKRITMRENVSNLLFLYLQARPYHRRALLESTPLPPELVAHVFSFVP